MEDLWDDLAVTPEAVPVHDWQKEELARRKANLINNPASGPTWEEVKRRVQQYHHPMKRGTVTVSGKPNVDVPIGTLNSALRLRSASSSIKGSRIISEDSGSLDPLTIIRWRVSADGSVTQCGHASRRGWRDVARQSLAPGDIRCSVPYYRW